MRDRLKELQQNMASEGKESSECDVLLQIDHAPRTMHDFFTEVSSIRENLEAVEKEVKNLILIHRTMNEAPRPSEMSKNQAEDAVQNARALALRISKQIKSLPSKMPEPRTTSCSRILAMHESTLGMQLKRAMESLYMEQDRQREKSKAVLQRQLKIVRSSLESRGESMTEEQLENMLESGQSVFTGNILLQTLDAKRELDEIQSRHDDLIALEKSIEEVHSLFVDISLLVQDQGEMIDNIEMNVTRAHDTVEQGRKQIVEAEKKKTSSRKTKIFCSIFIALLLIVLILVLAFLVP